MAQHLGGKAARAAFALATFQGFCVAGATSVATPGLVLHAVSLLSLLLGAPAFEPGSFRLDYPPWGETGSAMFGKPRYEIPILMPLTRHSCGPSRYLTMRMAVSHVNRRDSTLCPVIAELNNSFEVTYEVADTNANGVKGLEATLEMESKLKRKGKSLKGVLGPNSSGSSKTIHNYLAIFGVPHLSWAATSGSLSNKANYPNFFRIVAPDGLLMGVLARFVVFMGFREVNGLFFDGSYQTSQMNDFRAASTELGLHVNSYQIPNSGAGGAAVSAENRPKMAATLEAVRSGFCRVCVGLAINTEAYDLWRAAFDLGMIKSAGWVWLGGDGISGNQLEGQVSRTEVFAGTFFILSLTTTERYQLFQDRWNQDMKNASFPEFLTDNVSTCTGGVVCKDHPEFKGWKVEPGKTVAEQAEALTCTGYTGLAYDAAVTMAVVMDRLMSGSPGKAIDDFTAAEWMGEMRELKNPAKRFECLTGEIILNENQDRALPMAFYNWHEGQPVAPRVGTWSLVTGFTWDVGATIAWPEGTSVAVADAAVLPGIPSGAPPPCREGSVFDGTRGNCTECPPGSYLPPPEPGQVFTSCNACQNGTYSAYPGSTACILCGPGYYSQKQARACETCPPGYAAEDVGSAACKKCRVGTYAIGSSSACEDCPPGSYADVDGSAECMPCAVAASLEAFALTTQHPRAASSSMCKCPEGSYLPLGGSSCSVCPKGMACGFGSDMRFMPQPGLPSAAVGGTYPLTKEGYMTKPDAGLEVFKCLAVGHCPGGGPGSCAERRDNQEVACGTCIPGAYESDGQCKPCDSADLTPFILVGTAAVVGVCVAAIVVNRDLLMMSNSGLTSVVVTGLLFASVQTFSIFHNLNIDWFEPMQTILKLMGVLSFNLKVLRMDCVVGRNPVANFGLRQCIAPLAIPAMAATLVVKKVFKPECNIIMELSNSMGTIFNVFFISIVVSGLTPFVCYDHPSGYSSVVANPSILCFESPEHSSMIVISIFAILLVPAPFIAMVSYGTYMYPKWVNGKNHESKYVLSAFRFLFFRFTPERYYYGCIFLLRNLLVCLVPLIRDEALQVCLMFLILSVFILIQSWLNPWRSEPGNRADGAMVTGITGLLLAGALASNVRAKMATIQCLGTIFFTSCVAIGLGVLAMATYRRFQPRPYYHYFICHHKAHAAAQARLVKILLQHKTGRSVFIDSDDLKELDELFDIVKCKVAHLVVYLTRETLSRPWCAGEIVTAFRNNLRVTAVKHPSFVPPTEEQLENLDSYLDLSSTSLVPYSITMDDVKAAFKKLLSKDTPSVDFREGVVGSNRFHAMVSDLLSESEASCTWPVVGIPAKTGMVVISTNPSSDEGIASTSILVSKIKEEIFRFCSQGMCCVADYEEDFDMQAAAVRGARAVIVILSEGSMQCVAQLLTIIGLMKQVEENKLPSVIPVNIPGFQFPGEDYYSEVLPKVLPKQNLQEAQFYIKSFFKRITVLLTIHASDSVLDTQAKEIISRIPERTIKAAPTRRLTEHQDSGTFTI